MPSGVYIKESLCDFSVDELLSVTATQEEHTENSIGESQLWTLVYFNFNQEDADSLSGRFSLELKPGFYVDFHTDEVVYIIFSGRSFKYNKGDIQARKEIIRYGLLQGVPQNQLDWTE